MPLPEGEQDVTADQLFRTYFANDQEHHTCGNLQCPVGVAAAREGSTPPVAPYEHKIKSAGGILMVQLLIYTTITGGLSRRKTNRVTLTETLDLSDYHYSGRPGSLRYRLAAVVIHRGIGTASINGGHYWTYVRDPREEGKWLRVDDNVVSREVQQHVVLNARGNDVRDEAPYLLFYERIYNTPHHNERVQHMPGLEKYIIKNVAEIQNRENAERDGDIEAVIKWKRSFQAVMLLPENERETRKQELRNLWQSVAETKRRAALKRQVNTVFTDVFGDVRHYTRKPENEWDLHDTRILGDFERLYRRMREDTPLTQTSQIELKLKQSLGIWLNVHPVEDPDGLEVYSDPTDGQNGGHPPDGNARMPDDETPPRPLPRHGRGGGGGGGKERQLNVHVQQRYSTRIMDASDDSIDDEYQARGRSRTSRKRVKYTVQKVHQAPTVSTALQTPTTPGQLADVETSSDTSSSEEEVIPTPDTSSSEEEEIPAPKHVIRSGTSIKRGYTRIRRGPNPRDITKPKSEAGVIKRTESRKSSAVARGTPATSSNPVGYTSIARRSRTRRETHPEATTSISKKKATKSVKRSRGKRIF